MREFKVGDRVTCLVYGNGEIIATGKNDSFPIGVEFKADKVVFYTEDGRLYGMMSNRTLFHAAENPRIVTDSDEKSDRSPVWKEIDFFKYESERQRIVDKLVISYSVSDRDGKSYPHSNGKPTIITEYSVGEAKTPFLRLEGEKQNGKWELCYFINE